MSLDEEQLESDAELTALLRGALRAQTPPGLSAEQRAQLGTASRAALPARKHTWRRALLLAIACALPLASYGAVVEHQEREHAAELSRIRLEEAALAAQAERVAAEQAAELSRQERERQAASQRAEAAAQKAAAAASVTRPATESQRARASAKPSPREGQRTKAASKASAAGTGSCDPNDALCGL